MHTVSLSASQYNAEAPSDTVMYFIVYNSGSCFPHFSVCYLLYSSHCHCIIYCSYLDPLFSKFCI